MTQPQTRYPDRHRHPPAVIDAITPYISDLQLISPQDRPDWLAQIAAPWQIAQLNADSVQPTRTAVTGARSDGGWDGCETVIVYRFTGTPPCAVIITNNDCTLRGLGAESPTTHPLTAPVGAGRCAVRSSGYFTAAGRRMWAQYSTYVTCSDAPDGAWLTLHGLFVSADARTRLRDDVTALSDALHEAFLATVNAEASTAPIPVSEAHSDGS
ncbi:hypothetical protein H7J08_00760 [Mycobacterium frederiksbergense]|uniref:hypothetical protein n=1 Tax=Mycolicibacterium frederiksbergense TaxID=117567 RepID=UPI0021F39BA8|nr:hypothetical protein [Mycolicibacterium frederiksbergense]MCV7043208.1 hypothetical protein [Mycolicibacterium frederiksbergense]